MALKIIDKWTIVDFHVNSIPTSILSKLDRFKASYFDEETEEHIYKAAFMDAEDNEVLEAIFSKDELKFLKKLHALTAKHDAFYFRIIRL